MSLVADLRAAALLLGKGKLTRQGIRDLLEQAALAIEEADEELHECYTEQQVRALFKTLEEEWDHLDSASAALSAAKRVFLQKWEDQA